MWLPCGALQFHWDVSQHLYLNAGNDVYFVLNLDELVKLPAVFKHYKQYKWLKNLTEMEN